MESNEPRVSILTINWNQESDTVECLESLKKSRYKNYEVILVDNGSVDGSPERIKGRFPGLVLIKNNANLGFAKGCNVGMDYALKKNTDYVFLLNNDTITTPSLLTELVNVAESSPEIGIVGAVNYSFLYPDRAVMVYTSFNWLTGFAKREPLEAISKGLITEPRDAHGVSGSSLLIKKEVIEKIGLIDERFFIYYEDTDWCMRARKAGFRVLYVPKAKLWHKIGLSFGRKSPTELYLYTRNLPLFMVKNCPKPCIPSFFVFYFVKNIVYLLSYLLRGDFTHAKALSAGIADFAGGKFGKGRSGEFMSNKGAA